METAILKNPPLIEALVEITWKLPVKTQAGNIDPHYQFLLGTFHESIKTEYPYHEPLPASQIPDDCTGRIVKHRFREKVDEWPLVQIGPGVLTVNETKRYQTFETFKPKALDVVNKLFRCYPEPKDLQIESISLRYIDAVEFDYASKNLYDFVTNQMHIPVSFPDILSNEGKISRNPLSFSLKNSFRCSDPSGVATLTIETGHKHKKRAIIWNQVFRSLEEDIPCNMPTDFDSWITNAHDIIHGWFEGIIAGNLKEAFSNE